MKRQTLPLATKIEILKLVEGWMGACGGESIALLDEQIVWHDSLAPGSPFKGHAGVSKLRSLLCNAFPDLQYSVGEIMAADDGYILLYWTATGTHLGQLGPSISPTGCGVQFAGSMVLHFAMTGPQVTSNQQQQQAQLNPTDSKVQEVWCSWDPLLLYSQLGVGSDTAGDVLDSTVPCNPKDVAEKYFEAYNTGRYELLKDIVHPDYRYYGLLELGGLRGEAAMKAMMSGWRDAFTDLKIWHEFLTFLDNKILFRWVIQGTHTGGGWHFIAASGKPVLVKGVTALTLRQGRIAEKVSHANGGDVLQQLGCYTPPQLFDL